MDWVKKNRIKNIKMNLGHQDLIWPSTQTKIL